MSKKFKYPSAISALLLGMSYPLISLSGASLLAGTPVFAAEMTDEKAAEDEPEMLTYLKATPAWSIGLRAAFLKFPTNASVGSSGQIYVEYLLPWQKAGVLSIGPYFGLLPVYVPEAKIPYPNYGNLAVGGTLRYQMKYFTNQLLVPTAALEYEYYKIGTAADTKLTGTDLGFRAGIMLDLGWIDEMTARDSYTTIGLCRTYLTAEIRTANISNAVFTLNGNYWYWGLRLEFD